MKLPQRPVKEVTAVIDEAGRPVRFKLRPGGKLHVETLDYVTITYVHGFDPMPDEVLDLVAGTAARLQGLADQTALVIGVTQESAGGESVSLGGDAWAGVGGLVAAEKGRLGILFPRRTQTLVARA